MKILKIYFHTFIIKTTDDNIYFIWLYICFLLFIVLLLLCIFIFISCHYGTLLTEPQHKQIQENIQMEFDGLN